MVAADCWRVFDADLRVFALFFVSNIVISVMLRPQLVVIMV